MINAESVLTFPLETSQKPMFAHLGTPPETSATSSFLWATCGVRSPTSRVR